MLKFLRQSLFYASDKSPQVTKDKALKVLVTLVAQQWLDEFMNVNRTNAWIFESLLDHLKYEIIQKASEQILHSKMKTHRVVNRYNKIPFSDRLVIGPGRFLHH